MLDDGHGHFPVTLSYACFTATLAWIALCIRDQRNETASKVLKQLEGQTVEQDPWHIRTTEDLIPLTEAGGIGFKPVAEIRGLTADRLIIALRNAVAHGDARRVRPYHVKQADQAARELVGFTFLCEETKGRGKGKVVIWSAAIALLESDLRRIARYLADTFCKALRQSEEHRRDGHFEADATLGVIEPSRVA
jgi:hypothetical protein